MPGRFGKLELPALVALTMTAFAFNSILNRMALESGAIDPASFATVRLFSGAAMLLLLAGRRVRFRAPGRWVGVAGLSVYMLGFSLAYLTLDAGLGALVLFGTVQLGMFGWVTARGARPSGGQFLGVLLAFGGLSLALWPSDQGGADGVGFALMVLGGIGWAVYTLAGRGAQDPLAETAANFALSFPLGLVGLIIMWATGGAIHVTLFGVGLAIVAGAVTSGLGYALWYAVLPRIQTQTAAVVQLSVPLIAILAGSLLLGEVLTLSLAISALCVLGGIAITVRSGSARAGRR